MISVTGIGLSRARLGDHFSAYSRFARRTAARDHPSCNERTSSLHPITHDALGLEDELFFVPVVVVDVGAVETLDHLGGAGAGFDDLEDAEGDEGAAQSVMQSLQVPEVTALRYSLPTCVMRARICVFAARMSLPSLSFRSQVAEQDTAGMLKRARTCGYYYGRWMSSAPSSYRRGRGRVVRSRFP